MGTMLIVANVGIAVGYLGIALVITRGLVETRQLGRRNPLATATAAIFFSCAAGHAIHVEHLLLQPEALRLADIHLVAIDSITAVIAGIYLSLRRRFPVLWTGPEMYTSAVRAEAQQQIMEAEAMFRTSFDGAPIGMALLTPDGRYMMVNTAFERVVGRDAAELMSLTARSITHPDDVALDAQATRALLSAEVSSHQHEKRYLRPDGSAVPVLLSVSLIRHPSGTPRHFVVQVIDLSDQHAATQAAADADGRFSAVYEASPVGIAVLEGDTVIRANSAMRSLVMSRRLVGTSFPALFLPEDHGAIQAALLGAGTVDARLTGPADGRVCEIHAAPLASTGADRHIVQVLDVSERIAHEARLRDLADHDALTGLLNRRRLNEELHVAAASCRQLGTTGALLLMDLDGFKLVNDSLGHGAGDKALVAIANTLRAVAGPGAHIARVGGDEFAVLIPSISSDRAVAAANTIVGALRHRTRTSDDGPIVTASVGIAMLGEDLTLSTDDLMARADLAVYDAKDAGRNRVAVYDPSSGRRELVAMRQQWIDRLRTATGQLVAYAQPIVPTDPQATGRRIELLVRYREEDGSFVPPGEFLPIAEQTGLIGDIDRWMLAQAVQLITESPEDLHVAVNLSAQTFVDPSLLAFLDDLAIRSLPRRSLMIEITETAALADAATVAAIAEELRDRGCELALDDFGSGFATFDYLQRLDVDLLKIDGTFIHHLATNPTAQMIVESIVTLAGKLGLPVVAEHVEDPESLRLLIEMGVEYVQGYLFSRPEPVSTMLAGWDAHAGHRAPILGSRPTT